MGVSIYYKKTLKGMKWYALNINTVPTVTSMVVIVQCIYQSLGVR